MASSAAVESRPQVSARTPWWAYSVFFMGAQGLFGIYVLAVLLLDFHNPRAEPYLSPFFSPLFAAPTLLGVVISPGFFVLWSPLAFRASCYYYRKAYYRAFLAPPACAVAPPSALQRLKYKGETVLPMVLSNFHRFALYTAIVNVAFLLVDVVVSLVHYQGHFYIGLGTILLTFNVLMLSAYTFGCHAFRHLAGGSLDCYSCGWAARTRHSLWEKVTYLNQRHGLFALISLFTVWGADVFVRLLAHGVFSDPHFLF